MKDFVSAKENKFLIISSCRRCSAVVGYASLLMCRTGICSLARLFCLRDDKASASSLRPALRVCVAACQSQKCTSSTVAAHSHPFALTFISASDCRTVFVSIKSRSTLCFMKGCRWQEESRSVPCQSLVLTAFVSTKIDMHSVHQYYHCFPKSPSQTCHHSCCTGES